MQFDKKVLLLFTNIIIDVTRLISGIYTNFHGLPTVQSVT